MPTVLITGASRGIGLEFARQYAVDGWKVIATCRDPKKADALNAISGAVTVHALDVDDPGAAKALAETLKDEAVDLLINNAGIYGPKPVSMDDANFDAWGRVFRTNAMAPLAVATAFLPNVRKGKDKTIATVSSQMGSIADTPNGGEYIYRSSKAAVNMVMKVLANDLAGTGIKVVVMHPGWVRTDMGGPNAHIGVEESVTGMRGVLAGLKEGDSGRFFNYDGREIPW